ncbi:unnamed protein product [Microthlaspi erraticum]|uniref:Protein kinase domain-containing protein n=1 Tax=Microthlaspi erraticum TaxID=1685480 RepID=A0A6D2J3W6_9BRAS|nr:unnamed protein product [Microthlaspi erraticum]CAA7056866.1 unnamed protein product [Microthlaspi erraticum]
MTLNFLLFFSFLTLLRVSAGFSSPEPNYFNSLLPSDAVALLSFKSTADLDNKLLYSLTERYDYCQWRGVKCAQGRIVRLVLSGVGLRGYFSSATLSRLDQLRVLSLENNSLFGPIPDLSALVNLKSLFLSRNEFSGAFPPSILSLHRLMVLSLSHNNFTGPIPPEINSLDRLTSLNLELNRFNGTLPSMNQSFLSSFNISGNNLTGFIPATPTLSRFGASSFSSNPGLCGEIINRACASRSPFFGSTNKTSSSSQAPLGQSAQAQNGGAVVISPVVSRKKGKATGLVLGFTVGLASLIVLGLCLVVFSLVMKKRNDDGIYEPSQKGEAASSFSQQQHQNQTPRTRTVPILNSNSSSDPNVKEVKLQSEQLQSRIPNSGSLVFCDGDGGESTSQGMYTLEQLMRASAELLGRGSVGITYKAVLDNQLIVTVKRLDAAKTAVTSEEAFENHMGIVGGLRHLNLVPIRAYFQSNGERLIIYDYQPNGSLFNLIHGSRSSRAKPLHWTSCLKIAEDVAQGLYYIHQSSSALVHGNVKSTNILLGQDFEACLTDYCLSILTDPSSSSSSSSASTDDQDSSSYKAPEIRKSSRRPTSKCDVYSFGVLIFELLTGKNASRHPFMAPHDMLDWVRAMREEEEGAEDNRLGMLTETACLCRVTSPEQRPTMRQVIKMIQEIKESVMAEENDPFR